MNDKVVIRSSARDLHGLRTGRDLLNKAVDAVNGSYKMRQLANHRRDYPPTGYLDKAELVIKDELDLVVAEVFRYSDSQPVSWDDTLEMQKLNEPIKFKLRVHESDRLTLTLDPNNFPSHEKYEEAVNEIGSIISEPINVITDTRKAFHLDNRVIISLGIYWSVVKPFIEPFLKKIGEKVAEDIAGDLYDGSKKKIKSAYEDIRKILTVAKRTQKKSKNPTEIIFEINGTTRIELHAKSDNADNLVKSLSPARLVKVHKRIEELQQHIIIEETHFSLNEKGQWYFTYLITDEGTIIGTKSIIKKRDQLVKRINLSPNKGFSIGADVTYE
jgi:hypothetical protein